jgi:hypothetical protein
LTLVLLVGAGLLLRTLERLGTHDPGFRPQGLVAMRISLPREDGNAQAGSTQIGQVAATLVERVRSLPRVTDASVSWDVPLSNIAWPAVVQFGGSEAEEVRARRHRVTPNHFRTLGVPILEGRDFTWSDTLPSERRVAIISQRTARRYWPDGGPFTQGRTARRPSCAP